MTLNTRFAITSQVDPWDVFMQARTIVGADCASPSAQYVESGDAMGDWTADGHHPQTYRMVPDQGFDALLRVTHAHDHTTLSIWGHPTDTDPIRPPGTVVEVSWDTPYGFRDGRGWSCNDLHASYVRNLGLWCEARDLTYAWQNEYTGDWFEDWRLARDELEASGMAAQDWFHSIARPAIERNVGSVSWAGGKEELS